MKGAALAALLLLTAGKKKPAPKPAPQDNAALSKTLDGAQEKVAACVLDGAAAGKWTVTVKVHLTLNSAGQLMGAKVNVTPESAKTGTCVESVLHGLPYPKLSGPIADVDREWQFSQQ